MGEIGIEIEQKLFKKIRHLLRNLSSISNGNINSLVDRKSQIMLLIPFFYLSYQNIEKLSKIKNSKIVVMRRCHLRMNIKAIKNPFAVFKLFVKKGTSYLPAANQTFRGT